MLRVAALTAAAIVVLFPVYITVVNSLSPDARFFKYPPPIFPRPATLGPYFTAWRRAHMGRYLFNSALVAGGITTAQVATSILAAYAFAFIPFRGRGVVFGLFLAATMVPFE